jgi:hypothetical protein
MEVEFERKEELDNSSEILNQKSADNLSKDLFKKYGNDYTFNLTLQYTTGFILMIYIKKQSMHQ